MKFITIDLAFMVQNKLSPQQAMFFSYLNSSLLWSGKIIDGKKVWNWVSRQKVVSDIPLVTEKTDTVYRWFCDFEKMGLIHYEKIKGKDCFYMTELGKKWNSNSDSHPTKLGQSSENNSDSHPTNRYNNTNRENIDKENILSFCEQIVRYLNEKTGSSFRASTTSTKSKIEKLLNQEFTIEDVKLVIDLKTASWLNDSKMSEYLRPETLFGSKFEAYLQEAKRSLPKSKPSLPEQQW